MRAVCKLTVEWKIWNRSKRVCWTKIIQACIIQGISTNWRIYGLGQKVWKEFKFVSSRRVITVHLAITVVKILPKILISMWHRRCAENILDKNSAVPLHCCDCLGIPSWMCGAYCWPVSESGTDRKYLSVGFIFKILRGFSWLVKKRSRLRRFILKYSNPWTVFHRCWTASSSAHWKLVSYLFLSTTSAMLPVFWGFLQMF